MIMADVIEIHRKKKPMNLALVSHKYSLRNTKLGITFFHRCENLFWLRSRNQTLSKKLWFYSKFKVNLSKNPQIFTFA